MGHYRSDPDLDYENIPMSTAQKPGNIDEGTGRKDYIRAVVSHGWGICSDVEPVEKDGKGSIHH